MEKRSSFWTIAAVVAFYWVISITTVFINKVLLSSDTVRLDAPFFITWFQCVISALYYFIYEFLFEPNVKKSPFQWRILRQVFPLAVVFASMIVFNNLCLKHVDVSFYYIGRSLTTVFNVCLTYVVLRQRTSLKTCFCCVFIVAGFWLGVDQEKFVGTLSVAGTIYGILASLSVAYYAIKVKEVLPQVDSIIWLLSYYCNVYSVFIFIPLIVSSGELQVLYAYDQFFSAYIWLLLVISGLCGLAIGYATALQIKVTSPLTHNISGTAKACAQTVLASYYYNEIKPGLWWISNWIVLIGSLAYAKVRQEEMSKPDQLPK
ncbi:hypothetical protein V9T40_004960 [Parthenolecanium corni]|uniref:Sugar phosphate transporter domain-containing protein n=1 Tax=Parthenolecanium corni TaxID=536013 RepID=A0AAN9Y2K1_9HEMI